MYEKKTVSANSQYKNTLRKSPIYFWHAMLLFAYSNQSGPGKYTSTEKS